MRSEQVLESSRRIHVILDRADALLERVRLCCSGSECRAQSKDFRLDGRLRLRMTMTRGWRWRAGIVGCWRGIIQVQNSTSRAFASPRAGLAGLNTVCLLALLSEGV